MERRVRLRFAPSPTGPLHIGGVRTALYSYLYAKQHHGDFILRIEDTDQNRFVAGAEAYIINSLKWCGIIANEGVGFGDGKHAPYRQSERKQLYSRYAEQLITAGYAYYAFDTAAELDAERKKAEASGGAFLYNAANRNLLKNSLTLSTAEVQQKITSGEQPVIRLKTPENEEIKFTDIIRGAVSFHSAILDDKVLLKSDGMPTYHLAHIVDDYLMEITHAVRGEEWLPSAPAHILIYRYLGWENEMPQYAHLPLLLKPEGNGKLSKRDGDRLGFPVFPLEWKDPNTGEISSGYCEQGYFPEAFVNMLAFLGWNPGTEQELFSMAELIDQFSFEHIHKGGARFDPEKAKWYNQQYLRRKPDEELAEEFMKACPQITVNGQEYVQRVCRLVKEKASFVSEFWNLSSYLFISPEEYHFETIRKKWNDHYPEIFNSLIANFKSLATFTRAEADNAIKETAAQHHIKPGEIMQPLRILLSGKGSGVDLLGMIELLGRDEICRRIEKGLIEIKKEVLK
jgi:glutamyl-tRNA synthetase